MTRTTNLTGSGAQTIIFEEPRYFSFLVNDYNNNQFISQQLTFSSPSQHLLGILLSLLPSTRNLPFLNLPNSFHGVVRQQLICWLLLLPSLFMLLIGCLLFTDTREFVDTFKTQHSVQSVLYAEYLYWRWRQWSWTDFLHCCWGWDTDRQDVT